jgi:hypothetical protein
VSAPTEFGHHDDTWRGCNEGTDRDAPGAATSFLGAFMPAHHAHPGRGPAPGTPADDGTPAPGRSVVDIVNHLFARFDVDGDASITLSEWLGVVDPDGDDSSAQRQHHRGADGAGQ